MEWDACGASPRLLTNDETEALVYSPVSASDPDSFQIAAYHGRLLQALPAGSQSPPTVEPGRHPEAWCSDADNEPARAQIYIRSAGDGKPVEARLMLWVPESNGASAERGLVPVFAGPFPVSRTKAANRVSYSAPGLALGIDSGLELAGTENRFAGQWRAMINQALVEGHLQCRILPR